jgi:hypothetical protein
MTFTWLYIKYLNKEFIQIESVNRAKVAES